MQEYSIEETQELLLEGMDTTPAEYLQRMRQREWADDPIMSVVALE